MMRPTQQQLQQMFTYDPEEGIFRWAINKNSRARIGRKAGCIQSSGYVQITINSHPFLAHQLAWLWTTGEWPSQIVDHINRKPADNRIGNLRLVTLSENLCNNRARQREDFGLYWCRQTGKWRVNLYHKGKFHHFGRFERRGDAIEAAQKARMMLGIYPD